MQTKSSLLTGLAAILVLSVGAPAGAQVWGGTRDRDQRAWGQNDYSRQAYDNGYRRGVERGERDGRDRRAMNYRDERDYRNGDWGYNSRYGPRDYYRQAFRNGFEAGYADGYNRYARGYGAGRYGEGRAVPRYGYPDAGRYPDYGRGPDRNGRYGSPGYGYGSNIAVQNGYTDGLEKGRKDARERKSYDVLRHSWYRNGDRHYEREYGLRDLYKAAYRDGFKRGYDEAYRGSAGYRW
jgi:hypothetical protein